MIRYNRLTSSHMDLYLRGLVLEPRTTYELRMDIYGGPINIFLTSYNIVQGAGSHYVDYNEVWTPHTFSFTTGDNLEEMRKRHGKLPDEFLKSIGMCFFRGSWYWKS